MWREKEKEDYWSEKIRCTKTEVWPDVAVTSMRWRQLSKRETDQQYVVDLFVIAFPLEMLVADVLFLR